jgi:hypothetical protein
MRAASGLLGWAFAPLSWLMGVPWSEAPRVGELLGLKTVLNEFIAYGELGEQIAARAISPRSAVIAYYALCGFANFGSLAILVGAIGGMAPTRRPDVARLGLRSILGGTLASMMTGCRGSDLPVRLANVAVSLTLSNAARPSSGAGVRRRRRQRRTPGDRDGGRGGGRRRRRCAASAGTPRPARRRASQRTSASLATSRLRRATPRSTHCFGVAHAASAGFVPSRRNWWIVCQARAMDSSELIAPSSQRFATWWCRAVGSMA